MNRGNIVSGPSFRTALLSLAMFLMVLLVLGSLVYEDLNAALYDNVELRVRESVDILSDVYKVDGRDAFIKAVRTMATLPAALEHNAIGLFGADGHRLVGNIPIAPEALGWSNQRLYPPEATPGGQYRIFTVALGTDRFSFGQTTGGADRISERIVWALLIAGLVVSAATFVVGYQSSSMVYRKLENISSVMENVAAGDTQARLPVDRTNDQMDRMARQVNGHLDRLAKQTATTRNTIAAIAHDLRTPLNRVFLQLQEIQDAADGHAGMQDLAARSIAEISHLEHIFETILRISRIESSSDKDTFLPLAIDRLAAEMVETFEPVVDAAGQRLVLQNGMAVGRTVLGDRRMLAQMLANLIENASRYSPGGSTVTVSAIEDDECVALRVADQGPGIPEESREDVLEPFHRLDASRTSPGTGLGLALVNAVATRHGARLELSDNRPGLVVTIWFEPTSDQVG